MKRATLLLLVMATTTIVLSANASAGAGKLRVFEGTLGDSGQPITLTLILREDRPPALSEVDFGADMTCEDGTTQMWLVGMGWGGRLPSLPSHMLDLDAFDLSEVLHVHGKVQAVQGEGTFEFAIPALTVDEHAQICTTGELPWAVVRTSPPFEGQSPPPPAPLQVLRFVTPDGVRVTMTRVR
jgi:hypothetical protein